MSLWWDGAKREWGWSTRRHGFGPAEARRKQLLCSATPCCKTLSRHFSPALSPGGPYKKPFPWVSYKPFSLVTAWQGLGASGGCSRGAHTLPSPTASEQRAGCSVCLPMGHRALTLAVPSNFRAELGPRGHTRCLPLPSEDLDHGNPESCRMPRGAQPRSGHSEPGVDVCQTPWAVRTSAAEAAMCCAPAYCWLSAHVSWGC